MLDNNINQSLFYLNNAKSYVEYWNRLPHDNSREGQLQQIQVDFLEAHLRCISLKIINFTDFITLFKIVLYLNCKTSLYHRLYDELHGTSSNYIYSELNEILPYHEDLKRDIINSTDEHFNVSLTLVELVIRKLNTPMQSSGSMDLFLAIKRKNMLIIVLSAKICLLQEQGNTGALIRNAADEILNNADSASLSLLHTGYASSVLLAMKVHLDCLKKNTSGVERGLLLYQLKQDVALLRGLMKTCKRFELEFMSSVIDVEASIVKEESIVVPQEISLFVAQTLKEFFGGSST
jgi:hypothetical protein